MHSSAAFRPLRNVFPTFGHLLVVPPGSMVRVAKRRYPFTPRTTRQLERGDIIGVRCEPDGWVCLQVVDLKHSGAGSLTTFVAGALLWSSTESPPTAAAVTGLAAIQQGLTRIELFSEGQAQVFCNVPVRDIGLDSNFRDFEVGTRHRVWGWRVAIGKAQAAAAGRLG